MSLLIPTLLTPPSAAAGPTAYAYDLGKDSGGSPANRQLEMTDEPALSDNAEFTIVMFVELPSDTIGEATFKWIARGGSYNLEFFPWEGAGGGCPLKFHFYSNTGPLVWQGNTTTNLMPNTKYCLAWAVKSDGTRQMYINGVADTVVSETWNGGTFRARGPFAIGQYGGEYYNVISGPLWIHNGFIDLSTNMGAFVTGGTNPVDAANGCVVYYDMVNLLNKGSGSVSLSGTDGTPYNKVW